MAQSTHSSKQLAPSGKIRKISDVIKQPSWYASLAVDFFDLKLGSMAKTLAKGLDGKSNDTAKELAQLFVDAFNLCDAAQDFKTAINKETDYNQLFTDHELDPDYPNYHPLFQQLFNQLKDNRFAHFAKLNNGEDTQQWVANFAADFITSFSQLVNLEQNKYPNACKYIASLRHEEPAGAKFIRYQNKLIANVEQQPLAIDQQLNLLKSFVSPSCTLSENAPGRGQQEPTEYKCLLTELVKKIESSEPAKPIILHGLPGHGKTSSVRMLSRTLFGLYRDVPKPVRVFLFEFKNLGRLNRGVIDVIAEQLNFIEKESFFEGQQNVIIFDGLDERQLTDGEGDQQLRQFVMDLFNFSERLNGQTNTRCNLILTGRSQFVGEIQSCFTKSHYVVDIVDFDEKQKTLWLEKFNQQKQFDHALTIETLKGYRLQELLKQPILLAICAIMLTDSYGKKLIAQQQGQRISRALIYYIIIKWAYFKKWHHEPNIASWQDKLSFAEYFILLQAIAFIMVKNGSEAIKLNDLVSELHNKQLRGLFTLDALDNLDDKDLERLCSQLRISFFFSGVEDKAFSFIHKSFKDFLYATRAC